jgi:hypothetical protein
MSKFIEKLKKLTQAAPPPMGFHTSRPAEASPSMLLIGRTTLNSETTPKKLSGELDAVVFYAEKTELTPEDIQKTVKNIGDVPWGIYLEESGGNIAALIEAGCDFVVFSPATPITDLPQDEKAGRILQAESAMDDGLLRAVNDLPADAVLVGDMPEGNGALQWHELMIYRHLANFIAKPLIAPTRVNITEAELKALQTAEIDGVMVEIDAARGEDLKELRRAIGRLPPRSARKRDEKGVLLPRLGGESRPAPLPDEEEDE